jgi:hypothetical protein
MTLHPHLLDVRLTDGAFFSNHPGPERIMANVRSFGRMKIGLGADHDGGTDGRALSATSLTIGTGSRTFATLTGHAPAAEADWLARFQIGKRCRVFQSENRWMEGVITSRTFATLSMTVDRVSGSGTYADWTISPIAGGSWLQAIDSPGLVPLVTEWDYAEDQARLSVVERNRIAINGSAAAVGLTPGGQGQPGIAGQFFATAKGGAWAWAIQSEATRLDSGRAKGLEVGAATMSPLLSENVIGTHWTSFDELAVSAWIMAGNDQAVWGQSYATHAHIFLGNNGAVSNTGIIFGHNAIKREGQPDDQIVVNKGWHESDAHAARLAYRHVLSWTSRDPDGITGRREETVRIGSRVANPAVRYSVMFTDGALDMAENVAPANSLFRVNFIPDAGAYLAAQPAVTGQAPRLQAQGVNDNINAYLAGKGTGLAGFFNPAETTAATPTFNRRQRIVLPNGEAIWIYGELIT